MSHSKRYLHPDVVGKLSRLELRARRVVEGFIHGLHQSPYHGFSVEFSQHREYTPGDDVRHIDWRVFAKSDRYFIKQYEEETNLRSHLLLDCSGSMAYSSEQDRGLSKWDYAATIAASVAFLQSKQQDAVGLITFDHDVRSNVASAASPRQLQDIVRTIETTTPTAETNISSLFTRLADQLGQRSMIVLISDLLMPLDDLLAGLRRLQHTRHELLVLQILDADELHFPFASNTLFEGIETDVTLHTDPQALRKDYLDALDQFTTRVRAFCRDQRIDFVQLSTADSLDVGLSAFLASRMHMIRAMHK